MCIRDSFQGVPLGFFQFGVLHFFYPIEFPDFLAVPGHFFRFLGFFLPGFLGPVILLGHFLGTGLRIVHGAGVLAGCGLFLQLGIGAFLGLLGGKLVLGFSLCFFKMCIRDRL